jgi:hypothetical protein
VATPRTDPERIRALIEEVDRVCAEARLQTQRLSVAMHRGAFWPDRRHPRHWDAAELHRGKNDEMDDRCR